MLADPEKAGPMQAYMKTDMPFYGVPKPLRAPILKELKTRFPPASPAEYRENVLLLWRLNHREEKYLALGYAMAFKSHITFAQLDLYRTLIQEGAWWDFVDDVAAHLVGGVVLKDRARMRPVLEKWIDHEDMWLRRTALICQLRHRERTDSAMLFDFCLRRAAEKEFFIRKAIGWALRDYSRVNPAAVGQFLAKHGDRLSGLSRREAGKHL
jgi:3-methyladenine DNA glycosylase AlkD